MAFDALMADAAALSTLRMHPAEVVRELRIHDFAICVVRSCRLQGMLDERSRPRYGRRPANIS